MFTAIKTRSFQNLGYLLPFKIVLFKLLNYWIVHSFGNAILTHLNNICFSNFLLVENLCL
jgi:hypothetical protein